MSEPSISADEEAGRVVTHYPRCFGCGETNPSSMGLRVVRDGDRVCAEWVPPADAQGGPGIVHGGYLAAAVDEIQALLTSSVAGVPAMTAEINVRYLAPVLSGRTLSLESEVVSREGRKYDVAMRGRDRDTGKVCFEGTGKYIAVRSSYWGTQMEKAGVDVATMDLAGGDISTFFSWHVDWLLEAYRAGSLADPLRMLVQFNDVRPSEWLMTIDDAGLHIATAADPPPPAQVSLAITFSTWQEMLKERTGLAGVVQKRGGTVEGDDAALDRFFSLLPGPAKTP